MQTVAQATRATPDFRAAVDAYLANQPSERVKLHGYAPRVKVQRVLRQLLALEPDLEIEHVVIRGSSGCSDFVGSVEVHTVTGAHVVDFVWCCRWKAEHEGYVDYFGFPDQQRAAQEFDWRCFQRWERRSLD